jgi:hypothetical protein
MSKKSKNPRKGRREKLDMSAEAVQARLDAASPKITEWAKKAVKVPLPTNKPQQKESKLKRYKDLVVAPGTELYQALEDKDMEKAKRLYDEAMKQWKADYGDFDPAKINQQIRERFQPWDGYYVKEMYDVKLKTGEVVANCWPNAGFMMAIDGSGGQFSVDDVEGVRPALNPPY